MGVLAPGPGDLSGVCCCLERPVGPAEQARRGSPPWTPNPLEARRAGMGRWTSWSGRERVQCPHHAPASCSRLCGSLTPVRGRGLLAPAPARSGRRCARRAWAFSAIPVAVAPRLTAEGDPARRAGSTRRNSLESPPPSPGGGGAPRGRTRGRTSRPGTAAPWPRKRTVLTSPASARSADARQRGPSIPAEMSAATAPLEHAASEQVEREVAGAGADLEGLAEPLSLRSPGPCAARRPPGLAVLRAGDAHWKS